MRYEDGKKGYGNLWREAQVRPERAAELSTIAARLAANKPRYEAIARDFGGMPWWWVACVHQRESGANFSTHLHNGDPLTARTTHEPAGRPASGSPPFSFEDSARDALRLKGLDQVPSWEVERCLYEFERYNGFGYTAPQVAINSPYVWSFTTLYERGKYVADHNYSADAIDKQAGCAAIAKTLEAAGIIIIGSAPPQKEEDKTMAELKGQVQQFGAFAPLLVKTIVGPAATLGVKALAEALGVQDKTPDAVSKAIDAAGVSDLMTGLRTAEEILTQLLAPSPAAPVSVPVSDAVPATPTTPAPGKVDQALGGSFTMGWKTIAGIVIYGAAYVAGALGWIPADVVTLGEGIGGTLAGVGLVAKLDRYLGFAVELLGSRVATKV